MVFFFFGSHFHLSWRGQKEVLVSMLQHHAHELAASPADIVAQGPLPSFPRILGGGFGRKQKSLFLGGIFSGSPFFACKDFLVFLVRFCPSFRHSLRDSLLRGGYNNSLHVPLAVPTPAPTPPLCPPFFLFSSTSPTPLHPFTSPYPRPPIGTHKQMR